LPSRRSLLTGFKIERSATNSDARVLRWLQVPEYKDDRVGAGENGGVCDNRGSRSQVVDSKRRDVRVVEGARLEIDSVRTY
jgi:hypothetical protein